MNSAFHRESRLASVWGTLLLACALGVPALAGEPGRYVRPGRGHGPGPMPGGRGPAPLPAYRPGHVVRALPPGYRSLQIGGGLFFEHGGIYFQTGPGGYVVVERPVPQVVVAPPSVGSFVLALPVGCVSVSLGGAVYYRHGDIFYRPAPGGYVVVDRPPEVIVVQPPAPPPVPVVVTAPPPTETYLEVVVNGGTFYYREGLFYRRGLTGFHVVDAPVGAVLTAPPASAISIWIGDDEYFYANGAFYRKTPVGFAVVPPPANAYVKALPREAKEVWCGGRRYFYLNGAFYEERDQGLLVTAPPVVLAVSQVPVGTVLAAPPDGSVEVWVSDSGFYYFSGTFYRRTPTGCIVVNSPL